MKQSAFFLLWLFSFTVVHAQDKLPAFGKIDKADLEMKDCDFDPGAEAVELIDLGEIKFAYIDQVGWQSESNYRIRIKVLKASAVHLAEIKMRYYSKNQREDIYKISGYSFNLDNSGNITQTKLGQDAVFNKTIDKEYAEASFAMPEVRVGTVFEYRYTRVRKSFGYIPSWTFQQDIPVKYSAYNIIIPEYFEFTVQMIRRQQLERKEDGSFGGGTWYIMRNIPGLKDEPYSTGRKDYLQRIEFQLSKINAPNYYEEVRTTWPKIIKELTEDEDFGRALKKNLKGTSDLYTNLTTARTVNEKVRMVYTYVQKNMQWDGNYGIYSQNGIKDAWDKKTASVADINFILVRLLKDAGVDAKPLLVSTKDNGRINTLFPFIRQFNAVMAFVKDGDNRYVMNAADKYNPYYLVPYDVLNTNALVVDDDDGGLVGITGSKQYMNSVFFHAGIDPDGKIAGQATVTSYDYARNIRLETFKKNKLKDLYEDNQGIVIIADSITVQNEDDEMQPLKQEFKFYGVLQSGGQYAFLPLSLFTDLGKNPFMADDRVMDIDFEYPKSYAVSGTYIVPDNFEVNELPKNKKMILPDTSIVLTRMLQKEGNNISFRYTLDLKAPGYEADAYLYLKEFFKKMYEILDERIVLAKKQN